MKIPVWYWPFGTMAWGYLKTKQKLSLINSFKVAKQKGNPEALVWDCQFPGK